MNANQENKLSMYLAVELAMNQNLTVWNQVPVITDIVDEFSATISSIESARMVQESDMTGITLDKAAARATAERLTLEIAGALVSFGERSGNLALRNKIKRTQSGLSSLRDTTAESQMREVYLEALAHVAALASYGVNQAEVTELLNAVNAYHQALGSPRTATGQTHSGTAGLVRLFEEGDRILKKEMDPVIEGFKTDYPSFYDQYQSARKIVDNRGPVTGNGDLPPVE